jgi:hypothetical protein
MTNPSPREVIASTVARDSSPREELEASRLADQVLEALRSRGYAIVPIEPTDEMRHAGWLERENWLDVWRAMIEAS